MERENGSGNRFTITSSTILSIYILCIHVCGLLGVWTITYTSSSTWAGVGYLLLIHTRSILAILSAFITDKLETGIVTLMLI